MIPPAARAVLDALPHNVTVVDGDLRLGYANPAFWNAAGIAPETCPPGSPVIELVRILAYRGLYGPGDPEAQVASVMAVDRSRLLRRRVRAADGSHVTDIVSFPLPGGGYATCGVDVTAQAEAEATTEARLRMLEGVLGRARSGLALFDGEMRLNYWNGAYALLLGLPGRIRAGMTPREILLLQQARGEFDGSVTTAIADRMERDRHRAAVGLRERPSGDVLRFHNQPAPDGGLQVEVDDITALQRAEDEARRRATVLDGVLSTLPHGVCVYGPDRRVAMFNAAYVRLMDGTGVTLGERLDDIVRRRVEQGEYDDAMAARVLARMSPGAGQAGVLRRVRRNGTVIENSIARLPDGGFISVFTDVTAVHRAEAAARQRAELLDGVLAALPHGVCVYGPDRRVAMFNEAYTQVMDGAPVSVGDHVEEIANRRVAQGEFSQAYRDVSLSRRAAPDLHRDEAVRRRPNGKVISVRAAALPDGGHISVVTDVTALHQAEDAARERAAMLDAVMEALPVGVVVYGADERARTTNPAYRTIMGEGAVRVGESLRELAVRRISTGEQTPEMSSALLSRHLGPQERAGEPIRRLRPDGTAIVTRAGRLPDGGHIAVITDITALHRAEEELRARAEVLEASFAAMRHGFAVFGPDRRLTVANERTADLTGLPADLLVPGRSFEELVERQLAGGVLTAEEAAAVLALDRSRPHRYLRQRDDGRVMEILSDPRPDGGFVVTYSDVTALHRAEEELRHRAAMLEASFAAMRHGISIFGPRPPPAGREPPHLRAHRHPARPLHARPPVRRFAGRAGEGRHHHRRAGAGRRRQRSQPAACRPPRPGRWARRGGDVGPDRRWRLRHHLHRRHRPAPRRGRTAPACRDAGGDARHHPPGHHPVWPGPPGAGEQRQDRRAHRDAAGRAGARPADGRHDRRAGAARPDPARPGGRDEGARPPPAAPLRAPPPRRPRARHRLGADAGWRLRHHLQRRHRGAEHPRRAGARPRPGRGRVGGEVALPRHHEPRAAHAAQRGDRLLRGDRPRRRPRADRAVRRHDQRGRTAPAAAGGRHPGRGAQPDRRAAHRG
jgi:PAS domain-containing protein